MQELPTILIVDDVPANVSVLFDFLTTNEFEVSVAQSGESALQLLEYEIPDLILLDVMMPPGIDGFETCRRLKANATTKDIPVIFMTALSDAGDKVKGFQVGAVDYVTKPFQQEEVLARIHTHLTLRHLQQQLQVKNTELESKNVELSYKNSELEAFSHTVAHDLKNPLHGIIGFADILLGEVTECLDKPQLEYLQYISQAGQKMVSIIDGLLLFAKVSKQEVELTPLNMSDIVNQVQQRLVPLIKQYQGEIITPKTWPIAHGHAQWVEEIWANYLSNGLKYGGQPPRLELGASLNHNRVRFWVRDNGPGLPPEEQAELFMPLTRLNRGGTEEGHGFGLSIVQHIAEKLGGEVGVESQKGRGSVFFFTLPAA